MKKIIIILSIKSFNKNIILIFMKFIKLCKIINLKRIRTLIDY